MSLPTRTKMMGQAEGAGFFGVMHPNSNLLITGSYNRAIPTEMMLWNEFPGKLGRNNSWSDTAKLNALERWENEGGEIMAPLLPACTDA